MASVMISHSHKDPEAPLEVAMLLAAEGADVSFDRWDVELGDSVTQFIEQGIEKATHVILMWSKQAAESGWV